HAGDECDREIAAADDREQGRFAASACGGASAVVCHTNPVSPPDSAGDPAAVVTWIKSLGRCTALIGPNGPAFRLLGLPARFESNSPPAAPGIPRPSPGRRRRRHGPHSHPRLSENADRSGRMRAMNFISRVVVNACAIWVASWILPGVTI